MANAFVNNNGLKWNIDKLNKMFPVAEGTVSGTGVALTSTISPVQTKTFNITNLSVTTTDNSTAGAQGAQKLYTFPEGLVSIVGASTNLTIAKVGANLTATAAVVASLGSATVSSADSTLTSTEADIIPSTAATLTAGAGAVKGTQTPAAVYLNFAVPDAGSTGNDALLVNGTVTVSFIQLGDN
jgi:hypothetical protein